MADISLKNGAGSAVTYNSITQLKVPAADGGEDVVFQLPPVMQEKAVTITANGTTSIVPDEGKDGLSKVDVTVDVAGGGTADNAIYGAVCQNGASKVSTPSGYSSQTYPAATVKIPKEVDIVSVCYCRSSNTVADYQRTFIETTDYVMNTSSDTCNTVTVAEQSGAFYYNAESTAKETYFFTCLVVRFRYTGITGTKNGVGYDAVVSDLTPWGTDISKPWTLLNLTPLKTVVVEKNMPMSKYIFGQQKLLEKIVFPPVVSSIDDLAWYGCSKLAEFDFSKATVIPTLAHTWAFDDSQLPDNYVIKVPAALYDDWKAASNWSTSSVVSHIVAVE